MILSTRSTCGSQSVPRVTTKVITRAPRSSGQTLTMPLPRDIAGRDLARRSCCRACAGRRWRRPSLLPAAAGAANAGRRWPGSGPFRPLPWFGSVSANSSTPRPIRKRMPTAQAYLFPGRGTSGRRTGSGCVRSRSASRSPTERSSKRSLVSAARSRRVGLARGPASRRRAGRARGTARAPRPTGARPAGRSSRRAARRSGRRRSRCRSRAASGCPRTTSAAKPAIAVMPDASTAAPVEA